jgi:hypothetical protein
MWRSGGAWRPLFGWAVRAVAIGLALSVIWSADAGARHAANHVLSSDQRASSSDYTSHQQIERLRAELVAQVPAGSRAFIAKIPHAYWMQRTVELALFQGIRLELRAEDAQYVLFIVVGATAADVALTTVRR